MCGIAGYVALENADQSQLKAAALILGLEIQHRGGQSWGTLDSQDQIIKGLGLISNSFVLPRVMPSAYVIHTRYATHGGITLENQHPFTQGGVIGVHNGVISNHQDLNQKYNRQFVVDSQHIFQHINDGLVNLADIRGYGAIVYKQNGSIFAGTFNRGDFEVANTPLGKIYASTRTAVKNACRFADIPIFSWDVFEDNAIYELTAAGAFKRFEIAAHGTHAKWDDNKDVSYMASAWFRDLPKKKEENGSGRFLALPAPPDFPTVNGSIVVEEHDEATTGLECGHCYTECLPELHFLNQEGVIVCPDCARTSYAFLAPDEYTINKNHGYLISCGLCDAHEIDPIVNLQNEDMMLCSSCFEINFSTKGLTKVTGSGVAVLPTTIH